MADMIDKFKDDTIMKDSVSVTMVNAFGKKELAVDAKGVFLDALSAFWSSFYDSCSNGEDERVPAIRHDFQLAEWESVGRILVKGYQQLKFFPVKLNKAFIVAALFGEGEVTDVMLLNSFLGYLSRDERELVSISIDNKLSEEQQEEWIEFLDRYNCKTIPKPEKVRSVILEIAHREIIQYPLYIVESWSSPLTVMRQCLPTPSHVNELFDKAKPTNKKVLALLYSSPVNSAQREAVSYLQRYIRGLDEEKLTKLLRFCTGSTMICVQRIALEFTNLDGMARRPVGHTCGSVLELPVTYKSYPEFREEMNSILSSHYWEMDFL